MLEKKRILVTGAAGVIGRELVGLLSKAGAQIRAVDLAERPAVFGDNVDYFRMDLSDPNSQFLFRFEPEYVFHLAADFERSVENESFWEPNFLNNILASHNLIAQVLKAGTLKKIIFASSYLIYDKKLYNDVSKNNILSENLPIDPRNLCGIAKLQTERDIAFFGEHSKNKFDFVCARIFRVYGRGSRDIISRWIRNAMVGEPAEIFDEDNAFDYIYAGDVALGLLKMAESEKAKGIINLGTGKSIKIEKVFSEIKNKFPDFFSIKKESSIFKESSCADISKLKEATGWFPETSLEEGIENIINYEKGKQT